MGRGDVRACARPPGIRSTAARRAGPERSGNCMIASRLLHEKHLSAASRQGSQRHETCSFGASFTGNRSGTCSPNTCSMLCRPWRIAMPPLRKNLVDIAQAPIDHAAELRRVDARFLAQLTRRRLGQRLSVLLASGHGLPMIREVGAFEKQRPQIGVMDDDQGRDRNFVRFGHQVRRAVAAGRSVPCPPGASWPAGRGPSIRQKQPERLAMLLPVLGGLGKNVQCGFEIFMVRLAKLLGPLPQNDDSMLVHPLVVFEAVGQRVPVMAEVVGKIDAFFQRLEQRRFAGYPGQSPPNRISDAPPWRRPAAIRSRYPNPARQRLQRRSAQVSSCLHPWVSMRIHRIRLNVR